MSQDYFGPSQSRVVSRILHQFDLYCCNFCKSSS